MLNSNNKKHNTAMELAYKSIAEIIQNKEKLLKTCKYCGAEVKKEADENLITINYLYANYNISLKNESSTEFKPEGLSYLEKVYILHYLTSYKTKNVVQIKKEFAGFKNLPGGMFYYPAFRKNGPAKILKAFGQEPEKIYASTEILGGSRENIGDVSVKLNIFPKIEMIIVLYKEDDEFPPEVQFLYNSDIINYLGLEDISILSGVVAGKFI